MIILFQILKPYNRCLVCCKDSERRCCCFCRICRWMAARTRPRRTLPLFVSTITLCSFAPFTTTTSQYWSSLVSCVTSSASSSSLIIKREEAARKTVQLHQYCTLATHSTLTCPRGLLLTRRSCCVCSSYGWTLSTYRCIQQLAGARCVDTHWWWSATFVTLNLDLPTVWVLCSAMLEAHSPPPEWNQLRKPGTKFAKKRTRIAAFLILFSLRFLFFVFALFSSLLFSAHLAASARKYKLQLPKYVHFSQRQLHLQQLDVFRWNVLAVTLMSVTDEEKYAPWGRKSCNRVL